MNSSLHEKATEILSKAMATEKSDAEKYIEQSCNSDIELKTLVKELYSNILEDEIQSDKQNNTQGFSKSRIGVQKDSTRIIGNITHFLFDNKLNRIITLVLFLFLIFGIAFIIRSGFRDKIKELIKEQQVALLNTQYHSLDQWMKKQLELTKDIAADNEIIELASLVDSLTDHYDDMDLLKKDKQFIKASEKFNRIRKDNRFPSLGLLHRQDPMYLMLSEVSQDSTDNLFTGLQLGYLFYEYYQQIKDKGALTIPPTHDVERFRSIPEGLNEGMYISFCSSIVKNGKIVGMLFLEYNVVNEFSDILEEGLFGKSAETYAVDIYGRMISESRFTKELQKTYLLDYDTTKSSVYNIWIKDPGNSVYENNGPETSFTNQDYTEIINLYSGGIYGDQKRETQGSLMEPYNDYRGIKVIGSFRWVEGYNFVLVSEIDAEEAFIALHFADLAFIAFIVIMIIMALLLFNSNLKIARFGRKLKNFQQVGQYLLKEKIGEGGFGQVYKAEHSFLKHPVAIKLLKKEFIGTDTLDRFEKEVKVTASLSNPSSVRVYDYGISETGQFYYVMEYLNGVSLDKVVESSEKMPVGRVIHVLLHTCYSLSEAHTLGLVHRDVKPMNIMVCNQGGTYDTIKLLDFGLVKSVETNISQQTQINRIGGTPMFMAPERIRDPYNTDHRVDVYAIGAVGLYMLSGQYLLELISKKMLGGQETLSSDLKRQLIERKDVPEDLKELLEKCVSFSVDKRPESVEEIIQLLEEMHLKYKWEREDAKNWWKQYDVYS